MTVNGLPVQYTGYFCLGLALLGLLGVNVWRGGPLDRRHDAEREQGKAGPDSPDSGREAGAASRGPIGYPNIADDFEEALDSPPRRDVAISKSMKDNDLC